MSTRISFCRTTSWAEESGDHSNSSSSVVVMATSTAKAILLAIVTAAMVHRMISCTLRRTTAQNSDVFLVFTRDNPKRISEVTRVHVDSMESSSETNYPCWVWISRELFFLWSHNNHDEIITMLVSGYWECPLSAEATSWTQLLKIIKHNIYYLLNIKRYRN